MNNEGSEKQKLTLSVDKSVVEAAKKIGLNISEVTENVLKSFTFEVKSADSETIKRKYYELFEVIAPLLKKFNTSIIVGDELLHPESGLRVTITLCTDKNNWYLWEDDIEVEIKKEEFYNLDIGNFDSPKIILERFITAISKADEINKEKTKEIELAKRIIEAIGNSLW